MIRQRLVTFHESTMPVIEHYRRHHLFTEVNGVGSVDSVTNALIAALEGLSDKK